MWISIHISLSFLFTHLCSQVFHDGAGLIIGRNTDYPSKLAIFSLFSSQRRSHTDNDLKIVVPTTRWLRLEEWILRRCHWRQPLSLDRVSHLECIATSEGQLMLRSTADIHVVSSWTWRCLLLHLHPVLKHLRDEVCLLQLKLWR